ncbi:hypothetical protein FIU86_11845 [Roseovarius sp. THAF9]|uniref:DUF6314 family protein n=1 Tax=Roseovarius sp. THAF9 TaxID=2587847 RepID=UPI0012A92902|nr:DUF6314 family protein [Roseovarius sp. THAF9]QFT93535.1 hypothetical protein FIU86_11845 [Roseovarius sp. THAF9]
MAARRAWRLVPELADFEGVWRLERDVVHANAAPARFEGEARFVPGQDGLIYREAGVLTMAGEAPMRAERGYLWRAGNSGGIDVMFEDGRFFHSITGSAEARHWCDPDTYHVQYDFGGWPEWRATWAVSGPRKAYQMISRYVPAVGEK